ncbi:hypothetical protein V3C99_005789, partial [Haemonchus contortus]
CAYVSMEKNMEELETDEIAKQRKNEDTYTDRRTDRQRGRQKDRWVDRQTDKQTYR